MSAGATTCVRCERAPRRSVDSVYCAACAEEVNAPPREVIGAKQDDGKDRWDLLPFGAVREVVRVLGFGSAKYGDWNWVHVPRARERYLAALFRHVIAWEQGAARDPESGLHHLAHASCCALFLLAFDLGVAGPSAAGTGSRDPVG